MNLAPDLTAATIAATFLLATGMIGGAIPQFVSLSDKGLHRFLSLGTGMLLGTIFYHMLPEALEGFVPASFVILGLLGVFVVEKVIFAGTGHHHHNDNADVDADEHDHSDADGDTGHRLIGVTAFAGLSVHALMVGLGLATQMGDLGAATPLLTSLLVHKTSEAFSLSTIFLLAGFEKKKALTMLGVFALIEPAGVVFGSLAMSTLPHGWEAAATGLAAGTFLYVALLDLLPEVFHRREGRWVSLLSLVIGIAVIGLMVGGGH
jgi:zinc transporter ZupT